MGLLQRLFGGGTKTKDEKRSLTIETGIAGGLLDAPTRSRVHVTEQTALGVSAVWCAIKVISEAVGSLPLILYRKTDAGRERATDHPLYDVLGRQWNPELSRAVALEVLMSHALLWGSFFAEIERDGTGQPVALWPLHPQYVQPLRSTDTGELVYRYTAPINTIARPSDSGHVVYLNQSDVLVVPGLSPDGSAGYRILQVARENIAFSIAADRFGSSFFGNGAMIGGYLKTPNRLSDDAIQNLSKSWNAGGMFAGVDAAGRTPILEDGLEYHGVEFKNTAGLYQDTRKYQLREVARLFAISPVKLGEVEGLSQYRSLDTLQTDFYISTLRPWLEKIEGEIERKVIGGGDDLYVEFLVDAIMRGDQTTRFANYSSAIAAGWMTPNEVRELENLPPLTEPITPAIEAKETDGATNASDNLDE